VTDDVVARARAGRAGETNDGGRPIRETSLGDALKLVDESDTIDWLARNIVERDRIAGSSEFEIDVIDARIFIGGQLDEIARGNKRERANLKVGVAGREEHTGQG